ncbi:hypothetical protein AXF42_Ash006372 [Apostasia shenzhenica]|uniref:Uncharacterized protein n=1 Tax=Apostasia shenzhenica TaxID=1088818 RepID=A0A2I0AYX6_9ASPA|nr:hypothetical protein AXF42_Ash006372 [Apostasia shenzhenica]
MGPLFYSFSSRVSISINSLPNHQRRHQLKHLSLSSESFFDPLALSLSHTHTNTDDQS